MAGFAQGVGQFANHHKSLPDDPALLAAEVQLPCSIASAPPPSKRPICPLRAFQQKTLILFGPMPFPMSQHYRDLLGRGNA
jgi:hypothetical protein